MENPIDFIARTADVCHRLDMRQSVNLVNLLERAYYAGNHIFIFGNGGSGATASHFCEDLGKDTLNSLDDERRFRVMSLTDNTPYILAWANDEGYETIFEQQLRNFATPGDVAIGISGSGNSPNVLRAIEFANERDLITVGMTGFDGGKLKNLAQHRVHVPVDDMGIAECIHLVITHYVVYELRDRINSNGEPTITKRELIKEIAEPVSPLYLELNK